MYVKWALGFEPLKYTDILKAKMKQQTKFSVEAGVEGR